MIDMRIPRLVIAAVVSVVVACGDDDGGSGPATEFSAQLSGDEEVPAVVTTAIGNATLSLADDEITYTVEVSGLENPVVAHIHVAPEGENGPVRLNLCGTGSPEPACEVGDGVLATGSNGTALDITFDSLVSAMRTGGAYVNVHTSDGVDPPNTGPGDFPGGEIRGQIVAE